MKTRLPVLEDLRIATPCNADWDDMSGDDQVRFCGKCEKNVYNLSMMTRAEAESLVREKEGRTCVRFYQRQDGMVLTSDCPVAVRRQRLRQRVWASISGAVASAMLLLSFGRARADLTLRDGKRHDVNIGVGPRVMMGGASAMPSPPPHAVLKVKANAPEPPRPFMGEMAPRRN